MRSLVEQSEAGRDALVQQLQTTNESLTREKSELSARLGTLEQQLEALGGERQTLEKSLQEANEKLADQTAQRTYSYSYM